MSKRRLIGIDLAWGKHGGTGFDDADCAGTGCVELVWHDGDLVMERPAVIRYSMKQIIEWIKPDHGDWTVAVDAPLVVRNKCGMRVADRASLCFYGGRHAGARPAFLNHPAFGENHRGRQIVSALKEHGGKFVEDPAEIGGQRVVFETYPHIVTVELFKLRHTIKYKKGAMDVRHDHQQELVGAIRQHLCHRVDKPRLCSTGDLRELFAELPAPLSDAAVKGREDRLDGLICAYTAAWAYAGLPLQGLGKVGCGVIIAPAESPLGVRSCDDKVRKPRARKQRKSGGTSAAASSKPSDEPLCWQPEGPWTCCCGCGKPTTNCFHHSHDGKVMGWLTDVQKGKKDVSELPDAVRRINLRRFYGGRFIALDMGAAPSA